MPRAPGIAYGHVDASQGLLLDQDVEGIDGQLIGILHGQQLAVPQVELGESMDMFCLLDLLDNL